MARTKLAKQPSRPERQDKKPHRHSPTKWPPEERVFMLARWAENPIPTSAQREKFAEVLATQFCTKNPSEDYDETFSLYVFSSHVYCVRLTTG